MRPLPIRVRLTLAFAVVMAAVLAGMGIFVYFRVGNALLTSVDQSLTSQAREARGHVREGRSLVDRDVAGGTTLAEFVSRKGSVSRSSPASLPLLVSKDELARIAAGRQVRGSIALQHPSGDWRYAAAALRPVEAMRSRAAAVSGTAPGRLPVPRSRDEISRLATTLNEMLTRLEAAFEHERQFVANASHELRTPLAMLRTELELALRRPRSHDELEAAVRSAAQETNRLSQLAEDLLLIARADQGALPIRPERIAVDDLFTSVAERFARRTEELAREVDVRPTTAVVEADAVRVEQALANLLENALAHGAGRIELFAVAQEDVIELHVADAGRGFRDGFLARAFDRFSRADEARSSGGSGLGLSIVALIAQAHGGTTGAANLPGAGADVWLTLPRARVAAPAHALI